MQKPFKKSSNGCRLVFPDGLRPLRIPFLDAILPLCVGWRRTVARSRRKRMVRLLSRSCDPSVCCNGTAQNVLSREPVDRVFRDVIERCAVQRNPGGAIPRDGSSDLSGGYPELREEGECRRNPHTSAHLPGTARGPHNSVGPGGIGKAVGKGLFNDTDTIAVVASPSSPIEISSNYIHVLFKHNFANSKDQLLSETTLLGVIVVDVQRHNCE